MGEAIIYHEVNSVLRNEIMVGVSTMVVVVWVVVMVTGCVFFG